MNKTCSNCARYEGSQMCSDPATDWQGECAAGMTCDAFWRVRPFDVRDNSMGYVSAGESWYNKDEYPGWYAKIVALEEAIQAVIDAHPGSTFTVQQMKEKWGVFTLYWSASKDIYKEVEILIDEMERWSEKHCYYCGEPATRYSTGWIVYYCDDCARRQYTGNNVVRATDNFNNHYPTLPEKTS